MCVVVFRQLLMQRHRWFPCFMFLSFGDGAIDVYFNAYCPRAMESGDMSSDALKI